MIVIEKIKQGVCCFCQADATVKINGMSFCASCGDGELLKIANKCIKNLQDATVTMTVIPKGCVKKTSITCKCGKPAVEHFCSECIEKEIERG